MVTPVTLVQSPDQAKVLADFLFATFVYVVDVGQGLTARDVQQWHAWTQKPRRGVPAEINEALAYLLANYPSLWKRHVADGKRPSLHEMQRSLQQWRDAVAPSVDAALQREFDGLLDSCAPPEGAGSFFAGRKTPPERWAARQEAQALWINPDLTPASAPAPEPVVVRSATVAAATQPPEEKSAAAGDADLLLAPWPKGKTRLRCIAVVDETHDVKTLVFEGVSPQLFAYQPGQFMTLELPVAPSQTLRRSYTISSSPSRPHTISVTVKRVPEGRGSGWLHDNVQPGWECSVSGPHGHFTCTTAPTKPKLLLIAAGSGITPIMSMLRWLADTAKPVDVVLINNVRTPNDVVFASELHYLASRMGPRCRVLIVPSRVEQGQSWLGGTGRFDMQWVRAAAADWAERTVYTCGPGPYMAHVRNVLETHQFPMAQYHEESFGGAPSATARAAPPRAPAPAVPSVTSPAVSSLPPAPLPLAPEPSNATVVFSRSGKRVVATVGADLLELAEAEGIDIPTSCRAGNCGTCRVQKTSGTVDMQGQGALTADEVEQGAIVACVSQVCAGELVLEI